MRATVVCLFAMFLSEPAAGDGPATISSATADEEGVLVHRVESPLQAGPTQIRVLLPNDLQATQKYAVLYVLPVEAGNENRYGDGLLEIKRLDLQNKHQVIFVGPTFSHLPWYCDHSTDRMIRQETYFLEVVVPFIEKKYPALAEPNSRLLLGFSKSGWGAWSLILRQPNIFGRAAAWDAPLMMDRLGNYGTTDVFGTQSSFEQHRIADLLRASAGRFGDKPRLILIGYGNFRQHHDQAHTLMNELAIPHEYQDGPQRKHDWHSGWVAEAVEMLVGSRKPNSEP